MVILKLNRGIQCRSLENDLWCTISRSCLAGNWKAGLWARRQRPWCKKSDQKDRKSEAKATTCIDRRAASRWVQRDRASAARCIFQVGRTLHRCGTPTLGNRMRRANRSIFSMSDLVVTKQKGGKMAAPRLLQLPSTQKQFSGSLLQLQLNMLDASHSTSGANTFSCKRDCLTIKWMLLGSLRDWCTLVWQNMDVVLLFGILPQYWKKQDKYKCMTRMELTSNKVNSQCRNHSVAS